ncbi:MAG: hypothetical protein EAZ62_06645 [Sphingobacteriia bacterium]|nr:MAG: hypothetical protein EAZ62_06645 [Sphingobacteriia bacterium]
MKTNTAAAVRKPLWGLLNYEWMVKHIPFLLYCSALTVLYIANGHYADRSIRRINTLHSELKELQFTYKTLKSDIMFRTEETQMVKAVEGLGLKPSKDLPESILKK